MDHHSAQFLLCPVHYLSEPYLIVRAAFAVFLVLIFAEASQGGLREVEEAALTQFTPEVHLITLIEKSLQLFLCRFIHVYESLKIWQPDSCPTATNQHTMEHFQPLKVTGCMEESFILIGGELTGLVDVARHTVLDYLEIVGLTYDIVALVHRLGD